MPQLAIRDTHRNGKPRPLRQPTPSSPDSNHMETPLRGRDEPAATGNERPGNTPACAGKGRTGGYPERTAWEHPRLRGEG